MKLEFRPRALFDLIEIRDHLLDSADEQAAERVRLHLMTRLKRLERQPTLGIPSSFPTIRVLSPTKYPYRIYFTVLATEVVILHIRHTSRQLPELGTLS
jgi:plasmid stabilization system protein ParE